METRTIPSTGEELPVIGCGTYLGFDVSIGSTGYHRLPGVLAALFNAGGTVLDSSPMYGRAEEVVGKLLTTADRKRAFLATKVWTRGRTAGIAQMERSLELMGTDRIDLMQVHNLVDWRVHLDTLAGWKRDKRTRYVGVTHYTSSAFADLAASWKPPPSISFSSTIRSTIAPRKSGCCRSLRSAASPSWSTARSAVAR